ncbi:methylmalonyl Co-A mutase-associated GTPase MeaB [Nocardia sp. R16R-3T]
MSGPAASIDAVLAGEHAAIARMLTFVERRADGVDEALAKMHQHTGRAHVLGLTGPPGSGKSTLVTALARHYRGKGLSVGVLAVDPSSVFTGGAILGDRIRMSELAGDPGVFIRSIATRGALGGLSRACLDAVAVLDAAGKDIVILETVGVGQAEVDVISAVQTVAVVSVPGLGDDVQAIKAGLLEIADVHVVNKADREGSNRTIAELRDMLRMSHPGPGRWNVPVGRTVATTGDGVAELAGLFTDHLTWITNNGERERRARNNTATRIRWVAEQLVVDRLRPGSTEFEHAIDAVTARHEDPLSAAKALIARL